MENGRSPEMGGRRPGAGGPAGRARRARHRGPRRGWLPGRHDAVSGAVHRPGQRHAAAADQLHAGQPLPRPGLSGPGTRLRRSPTPPPDGSGAYATDPDYRQLFWATFYDSHEAAEQAAIDACRQGTGKSCQSLGWFGNQCGAVAVTQNGQTINGYGTSRREAARQALDACEKAGANAYTICRLWVPPICSGPSYSAADNEEAKTATAAEIEEMSADLDDRDYWGAVASDGNQIQGGYGMPDRRAAETVALSKCDGCRIVKTFKDSCAGMAWPSDNRPVYEIVLDDDPATAKAAAKAQCTGKYGACEAGVRCSGRRYPAANPEVSAAPPAAN
jgi:hypothetical protein